MIEASRPTIWSIGHSTLSFEAFLALLREHGIQALADVRHFPSSTRAPWADARGLRETLPGVGFLYRPFVDLGGFRTAREDSANLAMRNAGFRGYADHMGTEVFERALADLLSLARGSRTAIMCAEAVPWKCHRSLLSDALVARGVQVVHILGPGSSREHRMTAFAKVHGGRVT